MTTHLSSTAAGPIDASLALLEQNETAVSISDQNGESEARTLRFAGLQLWQAGYLAEAANFLTNAATLAPRDPVLLGELGSLLSALGQSADAMTYLTASLQLDPNQVQVWLTAGCLCAKISQPDVAEQAFTAALELDPTSGDAAAGLGLLYFDTGRTDEAVRYLTKAVEQGVEAVRVFGSLGQALQKQGDFAAASKAFERAMIACPDENLIRRKFAQAKLIEVLMAGGTVEQALAAHRVAAPHDKQDLSTVCSKAAATLTSLGREAAALKLKNLVN
jgi:tetratricopeptide (TPR) repeat protein